jgi:hypothetical protein
MDGDLHKLFRQSIPAADWQRIESGAIGIGVPDLNGCLSSVEVWIENKKTLSWKVHNIQPAQVAWIERRARKGGRVFIAVRQLTTSEIKPRDILWLLSWRAPRFLIQGGSLASLPPKDVHVMSAGGPRKWDWQEVERVLFPPALRRLNNDWLI